MGEVRYAQQVREYVLSEYIEPARRRQENQVEVVAGDIHQALRLKNRFPIVCQALTGQKFLAANGLAIEKREGPPGGLGARVKITYQLLPHHAVPQYEADPFLRLYGAGKEVFASLGGGEGFIRRERDNFYGPVEDE